MYFATKNGQRISFEKLLADMKNLPKKQSTILIGIDGCGGSGKTTFADKMKTVCSKATIVHMDHFYLPSSERINAPPTEKPVGADFDWKRLLNQVLEPLSKDQAGHYQRYDWQTDSLSEWHIVPVGGIVIVEGVYALRRELANYYDFKIWVDCPRELRLSRGLERDGEEAREMWENNWMVSEDIYVKEHKPFEIADLVVDGSKY